MRIATALVLLASLATMLGATGCIDCRPLVDLRHCLPGSEACAPKEDGIVVDWNETHQARWPETHAMILDTPEGGHSHDDVAEAHENVWWIYWGVDPEAAEKEIFLRHEGGLYRVRILSCP